MVPCLCRFPDRIGRGRHIAGKGEQQQLRIANPILFLSHLFVISLLLPFSRDGGHHHGGAEPLRHQQADRHSVLSDRDEEHDEDGGAVKVINKTMIGR